MLGQQAPPAERILDAALRQFELFGIQRTTMEDVARRAGLSRVTLYRRFPGRGALVDAAIQRELQAFLDELDEVVSDASSLSERMLEGFLFTLQRARSHRLLRRLLETEPETLLPRLHTARFIATATAYLAERIAPEHRAPHPYGDAEVVVRLILSLVLTPPSALDLDDPAQARGFAVRYIQPMLEGRP